ncbi:MAG TPA: hypothetical protein DCP92_00265 [Nitrospiraceae bacterium]|jgi:4-amino-4-deoxy-L-arabinose transferase-like glycosyltransferase|nr:hypothetical protein [Nitrospiraceae bacterium]
MSRLLLLIITLTVFLSFFRLGSVTLFDVDEAVFATATKEMVQSGNWITPTYNGKNRYDKPILFYWLMAIPYKIFGINEFSARVPSAVAASLLVPALFLFIRRFENEEKALYATLSFTLSIYFLLYSHAAVTDMTLTLFITLSLICFYLSVIEEKSGRINWYIYGFYLFSALAFLTKGLIGMVFPFAIALIYLFITEGLRGIQKAISLKGAVLFVVVSAPWYVIEFMINGNEFVQQFFIKHHFIRYTEVISGHTGPLYYYIPVLIGGLFPWVAFLPAGIRSVFRGKERLGLFAFIWMVVVIVFFSLSTTKLPNYILPAIPATSILISFGMDAQDRWIRHANVFIAFVTLCIGLAFLVSKKYLLEFGLQNAHWIIPFGVVMLVASVLRLYAAFRKKTFYGLLSALTGAFLLVLSIEAFPAANAYLQGTLYRYSLCARERLGDDEPLITYGLNNPSIVFYSGHKVIEAGSKDELATLLKNEAHALVITRAGDIDSAKDAGLKVVADDGRFAMLERGSGIAAKR